jgi:hypothetical protein
VVERLSFDAWGKRRNPDGSDDVTGSRPHSSFHRDVAAGIVPLDWAGEIDPANDFGER